jgi:hemerythrin-like metal-binding protein
MLKWSSHFETGIALVDAQHRKLFELLDALSGKFIDRTPTQAEVEETLAELVEYAKLHFHDEEELMGTYRLDEHFLSIHHMEHHSFNYDLSRLQADLSYDEFASQTAEKLVRFMTSWLVYHIIGTDQCMAAQMRAIDQGVSPEAAFTSYKDMKRDPVSTQLILDAVLNLWRETAEHARVLEVRIAELSRDGRNPS